MADQKPIKLSSGFWNQFVSGDTIGIINGGTGLSSYTIGDLLYASGSTALSKLVSVAAGSYLRSGGVGTAPVWSTPTLPNTATSGKVVIGDGTNLVLSTPTFPNASAASGKFIRSDGTNWIASTPTIPTTAGTSGKLLISDGTNFVSSTPTYPNASATSGKFIISDGTNFIASTITHPNSATTGDILYASASNVYSNLADVAVGSYLRSGGVTTAPLWSTLTLPNTAAISTILYASAANIISALATGNTSALVTNSTGVPSLTSGTTANRVLRTDGTTVSFAQVAAATDISGSLPVANGGVDTSITDYSATSTITGWSSFTTKRLNIMNFGKGIVVEFFLSGTSNSTSVSFTVPNTIIGFSSLSIYREDNGVGSTTPAWAQQGTGAIVKFRKDSGAADTDWTASGTKTIRGSIIVFFA